MSYNVIFVFVSIKYNLFSGLSIGGSAKSPGREFLMDYEKDKTGNFERGCS